MNLNRYSKLTALLVVGGLVLATVGLAGAVTVTSEDVPDDAEVETDMSATVEIDDLYDDYDEWAIDAETELNNVTWTITYYDGDTQIDQHQIDGQEVRQGGIDRDLAEEPRQVEVSLTGEVPEVEQYSYEPRQEFTAMNLTQVRSEDGATEDIGSWSTHHYTANSSEARTTIDEASAAVEEARDSGADVDRAESDLQNAIAFYNDGNFESAIENAEQAQSEADDAQSSAEQRDLLVYGGIGLVGLLVVAGVGFLLYKRQQDDDYDKLG